jgi:hypothetical protein
LQIVTNRSRTECHCADKGNGSTALTSTHATQDAFPGQLSPSPRSAKRQARRKLLVGSQHVQKLAGNSSSIFCLPPSLSKQGARALHCQCRPTNPTSSWFCVICTGCCPRRDLSPTPLECELFPALPSVQICVHQASKMYASTVLVIGASARTVAFSAHSSGLWLSVRYEIIFSCYRKWQLTSNNRETRPNDEQHANKKE